MRPALVPAVVVKVEEAQEAEDGAEGDKVVDAGMEGGVLGRRALGIKTRTLVFASKSL
jgi:hypothetical protein